MRVVCAPDSFKGSLSALDAAIAMGAGVRRARAGAVVDLCPVADGGEGTVRAMVHATGGELRTAEVMGPLGGTVTAEWGVLGDADGQGTRCAVVEMSAASGLTLVAEHERDPSRTTTFGTGELLVAALDAGVERIVLGLGGSATNDGGCGMAQALGVRFFDTRGRELRDPIGGADLERIARIDVAGLDRRCVDVDILLCCDVDNPLTGPRGAAAVYGPQKGASPAQVAALDRGLAHLGRLWATQLQCDVVDRPGAGAAGGMGGGVMVVLDATPKRGIDVVLRALRFDERVRGSQLCLTGEGCLDGQSAAGKACFGVAAAAAAVGVRTIGIVGVVASDAPSPSTMRALGMSECYEIRGSMAVESAMARAAELIEDRVADILGDR